MSDRPTSEEGDEDRIGYRRPPRHTQFKKGNRANPLGRGASRRGDLAKTVRETLASKVEIRERGRKRKVTRSEANILALFEKAKRGDASAADRLLDLHAAAMKGSEAKAKLVEVYNVPPDEDVDSRHRPIFHSADPACPYSGASGRRFQRS